MFGLKKKKGNLDAEVLGKAEGQCRDLKLRNSSDVEVDVEGEGTSRPCHGTTCQLSPLKYDHQSCHKMALMADECVGKERIERNRIIGECNNISYYEQLQLWHNTCYSNTLIKQEFFYR